MVSTLVSFIPAASIIGIVSGSLLVFLFAAELFDFKDSSFSIVARNLKVILVPLITWFALVFIIRIGEILGI
jgi:hypothetical protein